MLSKKSDTGEQSIRIASLGDLMQRGRTKVELGLTRGKAMVLFYGPGFM